MTEINKDTNFFRIEDSFAQYKDVHSLLIQGDNMAMDSCEVSIVIPTYKRPALLKEALHSAINQDEFQNYCILIVDNDPTRGCDTEKLLVDYQSHKILYFKNAENIGMFGNQNRCFELATTEWVVLLHDDDLLLPTFLKDCMSLIRQKQKIDGLQPIRYVWKDQGTQLNLPKYSENALRIKRIYDVSNYISFQAGTPSGGIFKRDKVLSLGGYNPEYYPTSDFCFSVIFAQRYKLYILKKTLSVYRILANESLKKETLSRFILNDYFLKRQILTKYMLPRFIIDLLLAYCGRMQIRVLNQNFNSDLSIKDIAIPLPKVSVPVYYILRLTVLIYTRVFSFPIVTLFNKIHAKK